MHKRMQSSVTYMRIGRAGMPLVAALAYHSPWAGSGIRTFRSTPPATFVSQLRLLSLDE